MALFSKEIKIIRDFRIPLLCAVISLIGIILRFQRLSQRELWNDEFNQIKDSIGPLKNFFRHQIYGDFSSFPGDYLITYPFLQLFGQNKWGIMIPHIVFTFIGFYLFYLLCRRFFKTIVGFVFAFALLAFNEILIYHNFEFRPYSVLPTLAIGSFLFAEILFSNFSRLTKLQKTGISIFYIFTLIFHIYGFILISLVFLYQFIVRYRQSNSELHTLGLKKYFITLYVILGAIWVWYALPNLTFSGFRKVVIGHGQIQTFEFIPNPLDNLIGFFKGIFGNLLSTKWLKWTIVGSICVFLPANQQRFRQFGFFLICVILAVQIVFLISLFKHYWFIQRQFVWVIPFFAFFIGWCWESIAMIFIERRK